MQETVLGCNTCVSVSESKTPTRKFVRTRLQFWLFCTKSLMTASPHLCLCTYTRQRICSVTARPVLCACSSYSHTYVQQTPVFCLRELSKVPHTCLHCTLFVHHFVIYHITVQRQHTIRMLFMCMFGCVHKHVHVHVHVHGCGYV